MRLYKLLSHLLLAVLLALSASTAASAKVASGPQNLAWTGHQAENVFNWLTCQGKSDRSTTGPPGCSVVPNSGRNFWTKTTEFGGNKVYQRDDLINSGLVDSRGRTNLERMQKGLAPIGADGKAMNLHHMLQTQDGPIAEITATFHKQNHSTIHINPSSIPSGIDRVAFDKWRADYWMNRANDFK